MKKILVASILTIVFLAGCKGQAEDGKYKDIAQCLTEKGVKEYGAFWCPNCANQKKMFGDDYRYITYIECDPRGENGDPEACRAASVDRYPTWTFPGQEPTIGTTAPEILAQKANCDLTGAQADITPVDESMVGDNTSAPATEIAINEDGFAPSEVSIKAGTTVTFTNTGENDHWPASDVHPTHELCPGFDSLNPLKPGETYSHTFDDVEVCTMHDHIFANHTGKITIE